MPIKKSAKKRLRQNIKRRAKNLAKLRVLKKAIKDCQKNLASKSPNGKLVSKTIALLDKAAKTGLIHHNKANRFKSKLLKLASSKKVKLESGKAAPKAGHPKGEKTKAPKKAKKTVAKKLSTKTKKVDKKTKKTEKK